MRIASLTLALLVPLVIQAQGARRPAAQALPASRTVVAPAARFVVGVVQDGRTIPVTGGRVTLRRAPFEILVRYGARTEVRVNASYSPALLERAQAGERLDDLFGNGGHAMAEEERPIDVTLADDGFMSWYVQGAEHTCTSVVVQGGTTTCRRRVKQVYDADADATRPLGERDVFLVFASARPVTRVVSEVEHAEGLRITFR